jgi:hypothetical protein
MKTTAKLSTTSELKRIVARLAIDPEAIAEARAADADFAAGRYTIDGVPAKFPNKKYEGETVAAQTGHPLSKAAR